MTREIKFRAWKKNEGRPSGEWVSFNHKMLNNEAYEVMQYTGLNDKNDKEIYEGDIEESLGKIEFINGSFVVNGWEPIGEMGIDRFNIIGNIYQNPELLS